MSEHADPTGGEDTRQTLYHLKPHPAERVYLTLVSMFVTLLVLTNVIGQKLFHVDLSFMEGWPLVGGLAAKIGGTALTAGLITYPLTTLINSINTSFVDNLQ